MLGKQVTLVFPSKIRDLLTKGSFDGAKIISMTTVQKGPDPFGQVLSGELKIRARFCMLEDVPPAYSIDREWPVDNHPPRPRGKSAWQHHVYQNLLLVDTRVYEFYQQHVPHPDQHFAVIEIVPWIGSPGSGVPGMDCLIVESTGRRKDEYRRVGKMELRKEEVPNKDDLSEDAYNAIVLENQAYGEVMKDFTAKWKKRTITLI